MVNKHFDFAATEERAVGMTREQLDGAIVDILATLPCADAIDRAHGSDNAGHYRDEISVYRGELRRRGCALEVAQWSAQ